MSCVQSKDNLLEEDWLGSYAINIYNARYKQTDIKHVVNTQHSLTKNNVINCHVSLATILFSLVEHYGVYPHTYVYIDIEENAAPVRARAYLDPRVQL